MNRTPSWQPVVPALVKAAYSSGKPALGVGAGNTPVIIDDTADITRLAVNSIIHSKTFDNGMICASEQSVTVVGDAYKAIGTNLLTAAATSSRRMSWTRCAIPS